MALGLAGGTYTVSVTDGGRRKRRGRGPGRSGPVGRPRARDEAPRIDRGPLGGHRRQARREGADHAAYGERLERTKSRRNSKATSPAPTSSSATRRRTCRSRKPIEKEIAAGFSRTSRRPAKAGHYGTENGTDATTLSHMIAILPPASRHVGEVPRELLDRERQRRRASSARGRRPCPACSRTRPTSRVLVLRVELASAPPSSTRSASSCSA